MKWLPVFFLILFVTCPFSQASKYKLGDVNDEIPKEPVEDSSKLDRKKLAVEVSEEFYEKGMKALKAGRLEQAEGLFDRALILNPENRRAQRGIETIMRHYDDSPLDQPSFEKDNKKDRKSALKRKFLDDLKQALGRKHWEKAHAAAEKVLALDPQNNDAKTKLDFVSRKLFLRHMDQGREYEKADDRQKAVSSYMNALEYKKDPSLKHKIKSLKDQITKDHKKRSDDFYLKALQASQNGNNGKAIKFCKKALELNPKNLQAQRMLARLTAK